MVPFSPRLLIPYPKQLSSKICGTKHVAEFAYGQPGRYLLDDLGWRHLSALMPHHNASRGCLTAQNQLVPGVTLYFRVTGGPVNQYLQPHISRGQGATTLSVPDARAGSSRSRIAGPDSNPKGLAAQWISRPAGYAT
jgi:hypothetical protein